MTDPHPHHHDPIEDNIETHPVKLAIGVAIGAVALIVGLYLLVQLAMYAYAGRSQKNDPAMSENAVKKRLAPAAQLALDPTAPATPAPAATPGPAIASVAMPAAPTKTAAGASGSGKSTYDAVCAVCHTAGVAGAPKPNDKAAWAPRLKQGVAAMHASAIKGKGAMPPKGGNPSLSDADVSAAVDYLVSTAK